MKRRKYCDKALYDIFTPRSPPIHRQFTAARLSKLQRLSHVFLMNVYVQNISEICFPKSEKLSYEEPHITFSPLDSWIAYRAAVWVVTMVFHCVLFDFSIPDLDDHFLDPDPHSEGRY